MHASMEAPDRTPSSTRTTSSTDDCEGTVLVTAIDESRAKVLKEFTTLLGTKASSPKDQEANALELVKYLSNSVDDDGVALMLPSLDLRLSDGDTSLLPGVGETSKMAEDVRQNMEASVLSRAVEEKMNVEQKAALNIGKQTSWTRSTIRYASAAVGANILESFTQLVNSRVRSWTLLLLRHSLSTGDSESRARLLNILSAKIKAVSSETKFITLPLPPSAAGKPKDADIILPLLFEARLSVAIQDKSEEVLIRAPGTVSALFNGDSASDGLKKVMVRLDSGVVLSSMIEQARVAVLKAVANVTKVPEVSKPIAPLFPKGQVPPPIAESPKEQESDQIEQSDLRATNLSTLSGALNLSTQDTEQSIPLQKARSSALKLNSVLHGQSYLGKPNTSSGLRKVRSVKWEESTNAPKLGLALAPNPKKLRLVETNCKLKSFKSFGRPHGGDNGSGPGNATFTAFGGSGSAGVWGRDGRLAYHPKPMNQNVATSNQMGLTGVAERNATFNLPRTNTSPKTDSPFSQLLSRSHNLSSAGGPTLHRTATALENSLLGKFS